MSTPANPTPSAADKLDIAGMCDRYPEGRWLEDKDHENGNYNCRCITCGKTFIGHKRRVECKVCATAPAPTPRTDGASDTEILNWIEDNASKVGIKPDWIGTDAETGVLYFEKTDIRKRVIKLMNQ